MIGCDFSYRQWEIIIVMKVGVQCLVGGYLELFLSLDAFYVYVASLLAKDKSIKSQLEHFGQMLPDTFPGSFTHNRTMWCRHLILRSERYWTK